MQVGFKEEQKNFLIGDCVHLRRLSDREAKRWAEPEERSDKHQRGARMPEERRAGQLVLDKTLPVIFSYIERDIWNTYE